MKITKTVLTTAVLAAISGSVFAAETTLPENASDMYARTTYFGKGNTTEDTTLTERSTVIGASNTIRRATDKTTIIGDSNSVDGKNNTVLGSTNIVQGHDSVVIGVGAQAGANVVPEGDDAPLLTLGSAEGHGVTVIGTNTWANTEYASAIGYAAQSLGKNDIALGSYSAAGEMHAADSKYAGVTNNKGVLSIGAKNPSVSINYSNPTVDEPWASDFTRQIQHVSAGEVSATSTDAINGSQLQDAFDRSAVNATNIATNAANIIKAKTTVSAGNNVTVTNSTNADGSTNYEVSVSKALADQVEANKNGLNGLDGRVGKNADAIRDLQVGLTAAGTDVTGKGPIKVRRSMALNGGSTFEVSLDQSVTNQINANTAAINNLNENAVVQGGENIHIDTVNGNQRGVSLARNLQHMESAFFGYEDGVDTTYITKKGIDVDNADANTNVSAGAVRTFKGSENTGMTEKGITIENTDNLDQASFTVGGMQASDANGTVRFTTTDITAGNQQIHGVKAGVADTDAVNVKQLNDRIGALKDNDTITNVTAGPNITVVQSTTQNQNGMPASPTFNVSLNPDVAINSANFSNTDTNIETDITATGVSVKDPNGSSASMNNQGFNVYEGSKYGAMQNDHIHFGDTSKNESADYSLKGIYLADDDSDPINITKENISFGGRQLHDVAAGTTDTDAVNVKQLKDSLANIKDNDTITTVKAGNRIKVTNTGHDYTVALDDKTIDQINTTETGMKGNARDIAKLKVDVVEAKTSVSVGDGLHVKPSYNANGSTNYHVTIDSKVTDQIKGNTDAIKANSTKIADNKARIDDLANKIDTNNSNYNRVISNNQKEARHGIAGASALAAMHPLDYDPEHKMDVMAGVGHFKGSTAVAIGAAYRPNENLMYTVGASLNGSDSTINAGVTYKVGTDAKDTYHSKASMMNKIKQLETTVEEQNAQIEKLMKIVDVLVPANTQA